MGKSGPCCHCGVTSTPLWRNGPHDKPVLCNACGTRWRTKGTLVNYTPTHVREPIYPEEYTVTRVKNTQFKLKDRKILKIKQSRNAVRNERGMRYEDQNFRKALEGIKSNRSSSESTSSYSESCANFEAVVEASDLTGSAQSNVWESESQVLPMKKARGKRAKPTQVEMLTKELHAIMQEQQCSNEFSSPSELLFENESQVGSLEICTGSVLLRSSIPKVKEDESEASSFPFDSKSSLINDVYSGSASVSQNKHKKHTLQIAQEVVKRDKSYIGKLDYIQDDRDKSHIGKLHNIQDSRDKSHIGKLRCIQDKESPLVFANLKDIINFEVLEKYMTDEEKKELKRHLPSVDTFSDPLSLKAMFDSQQFAETFIYFQQLLQEGIFEPSILGSDFDEFNTLKNCVLHNFSRSAWVVHYQKLKAVKGDEINGEMQKAMKTNSFNCSMPAPLKRSWDTIDNNISGPKSSMRSLEKVDKSYRTNGSNSQLINYNSQGFADNGGTSFSLRNINPSSSKKSSVLCPIQSSGDKNSFNRDLRLHSNFPECQLATLADGEESRFSFPKFSFSSQTPKNR